MRRRYRLHIPVTLQAAGLFQSVTYKKADPPFHHSGCKPGAQRSYLMESLHGSRLASVGSRLNIVMSRWFPQRHAPEPL